MKHKILWMLVSFLLVAALMLPSCAKEEVVEEEEEEEEVIVEEEEEEEEVVAPPVGEPQYGGTLTWFTSSNPWIPQSWDLADIWWMSSVSTQPYLEDLLQGDIFTYGPRGTNQFDFTGSEYVPESFLKGSLAESWEVTPDEIVFHIRPGIMWNECEVMESRELTAADVAHSLGRMVEGFRVKGPSAVAFIDDIIVQGNTVVIKTNTYNSNWSFVVGYGFQAGIQPPELVEADPDDWRNHVGVGTGAFILTDYKEAALATYVKNPNWWNKTQIINGKEYDTPFVDTLHYPFIEDESTRIAALRTGKIDWMQYIPLMYEETLKGTSADLILSSYLMGNVFSVTFRVDQEPFDDINIRRALTIGTDRKAIGDSVYGKSELHTFPLGPGSGGAYTPFEELPASTQELFEYDPVKAKQMLADAGYPDGFKMTLVFRSGFTVSADAAAMLEAMWSDLDITVNLMGLEEAAFCALVFYPGEYQHAEVGGASPNLNPVRTLQGYGKTGDGSRWVDEYYVEQFTEAASEPDAAKQTAILKDLSVYLLEQCTHIPLGTAYCLSAYWPWLKNYYGELECGYFDYAPMQSSLWIDETMKDELGY